ncbi:MAG TPA: vWA domain-containing protein [Polyangiales bacterium]|nr:vWA domain-containing protein [Polyangiales bacterium]
MNRGSGSGVAGTSGPTATLAGMSAPLPNGEQPGLAGSTGLIVDSGPPADANAGCAATSVTAPAPSNPAVDIIWVVDASGSMLDEQKKIGMNLTQFADTITKSNIDVRIVMMTTSSAIPVICPVTPPDPLSGTALAGDPRYKFIESRVDSNNALDIAVANFPMYQSFLRPGATTHFVTVSDDESTYKGMATPQDRANGFYADMKMLLGHDFIQHTISSEGPGPCADPNCMPDESTGICVFVMLGCGAARPGDTYYALAGMTKGLTSSICSSDWTPIFTRLSEAVIKSVPLPCDYAIPPPPAGQNLDPLKVNVGYTAPGSGEMLFRKATEQSACGDELGWFYDDPAQPKQVKLCPASCKQVAGGGTVSIAFGCETIVLI